MITTNRIPIPAKSPERKATLPESESDDKRARSPPESTVRSIKPPKITLQRCRSIAKRVSTLMGCGSVKWLPLPRGANLPKIVSAQRVDLGAAVDVTTQDCIESFEDEIGAVKRRPRRSVHTSTKPSMGGAQDGNGRTKPLATIAEQGQNIAKESGDDETRMHQRHASVSTIATGKSPGGIMVSRTVMISHKMRELYARFHTKREEPVMLQSKLEIQDERFFGVRMAVAEALWTDFEPEIVM